MTPEALAAITARARALMAQNADHQQSAAGRARPWYRITNTADNSRATVELFGEIGWDIEVSDFVAGLRAVTAPAIDLQINSPGGLAWDGMAIYNALVMHPANVTTHVIGIAASAASFIAMAGDQVVAYRPSQMMIHDASGLAWGNAEAMRELADILDQLSDEIAGTYARKAGGDTATWRDAMKAETWYSPDSAKAAGLVDSIAGDGSSSSDDDAAETAPTESAASRRIRAHARTTIARATMAGLALEGGTTQ